MGQAVDPSRLYVKVEKLEGKEGKMERRKKGETDPSLSPALSYCCHAFKLPLLTCHIITSLLPYSHGIHIPVMSRSMWEAPMVG